MPVYRIDRVVNKDRWWIQEVIKGMITFHHNIVYDTNIELEEIGISVPGEIVWVEQPNALAAFSQALMLFNGETK
jgi:hypothetical protein